MIRTFGWLLVFACLPAVGGSLSAQDQNSSRLNFQQQELYDLLVAQGMQASKAKLIAVVPAARQIYFDDQKCLGYRAKPGSDAYVACRAQLETGRNHALAAAPARKLN